MSFIHDLDILIEYIYLEPGFVNKIQVQETRPLSSWSSVVISEEVVQDSVVGMVPASGALS